MSRLGLGMSVGMGVSVTTNCSHSPSYLGCDPSRAGCGRAQITLSLATWQLLHFNCENHTIHSAAASDRRIRNKTRSYLNAQLDARHYKFCALCIFRESFAILFVAACRLGFSFMLHFYSFRHFCQLRKYFCTNQ